ncbi:uncharacterized protein LOC128575070 isoform X2 [Nycticebus coucang]|uniref:uncharacterized protein LOC128575070 isoform X2 n=1 Tax=Nycticebus coucang TaxID=9470 RepID=UPI00234D5030|nr:uncharacterized protein LOC128575070 isoform X2 [Nycticebus coucang]
MRGTFPLRASEIRSCFSDRIRTLMRLLQLEGAQLRTLLVTRTEDVPNSCNLRCFPGMCFPQKSGTVPHPQHLSQVSRRLLLPGHVFSCPPLVRLSARLEQLQAGDHWSLETGEPCCDPDGFERRGQDAGPQLLIQGAQKPGRRLCLQSGSLLREGPRCGGGQIARQNPSAWFCVWSPGQGARPTREEIATEPEALQPPSFDPIQAQLGSPRSFGKPPTTPSPLLPPPATS